MISEGKIIIDLVRSAKGAGPGGSAAPEIVIRSNRHGEFGALLRGRSPRETLSLLPMIFSVCGQAHLCVAARAFRSMDVEEGPGEPTAALRVLAENAREHLLRIILGWSGEDPETIGQLPVKKVMSLVADMRAITGSGEINRSAVETFSRDLAELLERSFFRHAPAQWLETDSLWEFEEWMVTSNTVVSRYLREICEMDWQSIGAADIDYLPAIPLHHLRDRLHERGGRDFIARPDWNGMNFETGPLARCHEQALVAAIIDKYGTGLLARHVARLVELAAIPDEILMLLDGQRDVRRLSAKVQGIGMVETARGRLFHSVQMREGKITDYRILAPTEWNFHPAGSAAKSLRTLACAGDSEWKQQAQMLVAAIDPCVDFEVRVA